MVVGAGFGQLPAILTAKKMGLKVIAIDKNSDALGMKYADTALPVDVLDIDGAIETAKKSPLILNRFSLDEGEAWKRCRVKFETRGSHLSAPPCLLIYPAI